MGALSDKIQGRMLLRVLWDSNIQGGSKVLGAEDVYEDNGIILTPGLLDILALRQYCCAHSCMKEYVHMSG